MEFNINDDHIAREFEELFEVVFQITSDSRVAVPGQTPMSVVHILDNDRKLNGTMNILSSKTVDVGVPT